MFECRYCNRLFSDSVTDETCKEVFEHIEKVHPKEYYGEVGSKDVWIVPVSIVPDDFYFFEDRDV